MKRLQHPVLVMLLAGAVLTPTGSWASSCVHRNVADLTRISEAILVGRVIALEDGFDGGVPYTQVTLEIERSLRGDVEGEEYTFRQFGLLRPKKLADGRTCLTTTPDGWSTYRPGEEVVVFLYRAASQTGLRTTVGLSQGKFTIEKGRIANAINNAGLFQGLEGQVSKLSADARKMLAQKEGPVNAEVFLQFVEQAVREGWFDTKTREERQ